MTAFEKLQSATQRNKTLLCVGLDTDIAKLPEGIEKSTKGMLDFNIQIIEATKDIVNSYKMNFAFYEQFGIEGWEVLKKTFEAIPNDILTIADAKRGDIGNTSKAYAKSCFEYFGADSVTVAPYMGVDSVAPFLDFEDKLVFLLGLTSNPSSNDFQRLESNGKAIYKHVFETAAKWAKPEQLGFVVGATHPDEMTELREITPNNPFLIPGIGAQGGDLAATLKANGGAAAMINSSRAVLYASSGKDFTEKAREVAMSYDMGF